MTTEDQGRR